MKKYAIVAGLMALTALTGCAADDNSKAGVYQDSGNTINLTEQNDLYNENGVANKGDKKSNFGYVRHQKNPNGESKIYESLPQLDREKVADLISKIVTQIPHVNDVGTLVTDEEVLVAYSTDTDNRNLTAQQVKTSAMSVVPRFYHVYVSDDKSMITDIERFGNLDSDSRNVDQIITTTIDRMMKSPQGDPVSEGENANGEMENGYHPEYDRNTKDIPKHLENPNTK